jgi:hypothetical protein
VIESTLPPVRPPASHRYHRRDPDQQRRTRKSTGHRLRRERATAARELAIYLRDGVKFDDHCGFTGRVKFAQVAVAPQPRSRRSDGWQTMNWQLAAIAPAWIAPAAARYAAQNARSGVVDHH